MMDVEFRLPALGENIDEGDVIAVLVSVGDSIEEDQPVLEMETGKATVEVPSSVTGTIKEIHVAEGGKAAVGQIILTVEEIAGHAPVHQDPAAETEPAPLDIPTPAPPEEEVAAPIETTPPPGLVPSPDPGGNAVPVAAAPSVRKFAREVGIDIANVQGTGPGDRITIDDVKQYTKAIVKGTATASGTLPAAAEVLPDFSEWGEVERVTMSGIRKATAQHMTRSWTNIPHVTQNDRADITDLEVLRKRWSKRAEKEGAKLTPTAILAKIVGSALKVFPEFNASIDIAAKEIVLKKYIHIGIAVDTPKGLVVPVLRNVDERNIIELAKELGEIAGRARDGKLGLAEMQGGTFTISNLGGIGGSHFTPIVNFPEVAILGVGRATVEPVWQNGEFVPRSMMPLSLSYDHRLIDGASAARFLRWLAEAIEEPLLLAMEG
jgi:pyruvate dehydrogenase E2 component (dihydrolipoamide acetyltransferase)